MPSEATSTAKPSWENPCLTKEAIFCSSAMIRIRGILGFLERQAGQSALKRSNASLTSSDRHEAQEEGKRLHVIAPTPLAGASGQRCTSMVEWTISSCTDRCLRTTSGVNSASWVTTVIAQ